MVGALGTVPVGTVPKIVNACWFRKHPDKLEEYSEGRKKRKPAMWPKQCEYCDKFLTDKYKVGNTHNFWVEPQSIIHPQLIIKLDID